ncbi:hypothetical protein GOP47_0025754 [Adiantum capillus-veneris]|uniref:Uncharacterized protein n=1 Tax=Adiantum capillus-veneris TaxID=13818 RepID=A0A9D4U134_ADICA|nr:hypothetical protein GOP47_0025754 [Adiantum capillus-veneris]
MVCHARHSYVRRSLQHLGSSRSPKFHLGIYVFDRHSLTLEELHNDLPHQVVGSAIIINTATSSSRDTLQFDYEEGCRHKCGYSGGLQETLKSLHV